MRPALIGAVAATVVAGGAIAAPSNPGASPPAHPRAGAAGSPVEAPPVAVAPRDAATGVQHYVDLNRASRQELMALPGVGASEATRIIANRPYLTKTELVSKNVLPVGPFLALKHLVVAMPVTAPKAGR